MWSIFCVLFVTLLCFCISHPARSAYNFPNMREVVDRHQHRHHHRSVLRRGKSDVESLRKLDALIAQVEQAAMFKASIDVSDVSPMTKEPIDQNENLSANERVVAVGEEVTPHDKEDFKMVALPYKFVRYDLNQDGFVTSVELADATGTLLEDAVEPFNRADINSDGLLTKKELHRAPWVFDLHKNRRKVSPALSFST